MVFVDNSAALKGKKKKGRGFCVHFPFKTIQCVCKKRGKIVVVVVIL
jgi:hypothetical protein